MPRVVQIKTLLSLPKNCWRRVLGSVVLRLYVGECTPRVDQANKRGRKV